jgi:hypothetical protein
LGHLGIYKNDNIKMEDKEMWYKEYLQDLINLAQNGYRRWSLLTTVMNLQTMTGSFHILSSSLVRIIPSYAL